MIKRILTLDKSDLRRKDLFLRSCSRAVGHFDVTLREIANDLIETLDSHEIAVGLSAIQIGVPLRVFVVDVKKVRAATGENETGAGKLVLVNPIVLRASKTRVKEIEACMSLPLYAGPVERPRRIRMSFRTVEGEQHEISAEGFFARVLLHELDHLDGVLYTDRMLSEDELLPTEFS